ncbi:helix-turn-helix transcriptional regulator [Tardiphaga sp. 538_B7_N1_4]|uniref:helix-turn-helix transcriptional regulator n=1 Tax=Tardiphaga sp. 538_B7_N1_4 TaxID=3240778 RepID=UPI003F2906AA
MKDVNRAQIKAARALLDWTQPELAMAAGIGVATLKRFETGTRTPIPIVKSAIVQALEDAGIRFEHDGKNVSVSLSIRKLPK